MPLLTDEMVPPVLTVGCWPTKGGGCLWGPGSSDSSKQTLGSRLQTAVRGWPDRRPGLASVGLGVTAL